MDTNKANIYAQRIISQLNEMFKPECENYINPEELEDHGTDFFHALGNLAPCFTYQKLCNDNSDLLAFNHAMNRICMQYIHLDQSEEG